MSRTNNLWTEITTVFRDVFQDEDLSLTPDTKNSDIGQWTSLNHAILIDALEKKFGIEFSIDEVLTMQSAGEIHDTIQKRLA